MKSFVGHIINKVIKSTPRSKKVSPTIKSVKPTKLSIGRSIEKTKADEYRKRYTALDKAEGKLKTGKQMMKEGQKERKKLVDTGRAFKFPNLKSFHAVQPGKPNKLAAKPKPDKKFKKGKELEKKMGFNEYKKSLREKKMGGGMMGRRFGMKQGTPKPKTNVEKIKETFSPKDKNLKTVNPKTQKGLSKLPREVRNKMGYMKSGGRAGFRDGTPMETKSGATRPRPDSLFDPNNPINKRKKDFKQEAKKDMK